MDLKIVYTDRYFEDWPSFHLIYEWEDVISSSLDLKLIDSRTAFVSTKYMDKAFRYTSRKLFGTGHKLMLAIDKYIDRPPALYFELLPRAFFYFTGSKNTLPVIIDFWRTHNLKTFYDAYAGCKAVLISSKQAYAYLKKEKCPLTIYHFPLSLPDKYALSKNAVFNKIYDIVVPGRVNTVLWEYLLTFEKKFPEIEYLYAKGIDGELHYFSNKSGLIGKFQSRESYMQLLQSSKISFYSTPGIDGDETRTGGFSPVTPRFLEMVAAGCHVIARYPENEETAYYEMDKIAVSADEYAVFERELSNALNNKTAPVERNAAYLTKYYTSATIDKLRSILHDIS